MLMRYLIINNLNQKDVINYFYILYLVWCIHTNLRPTNTGIIRRPCHLSAIMYTNTKTLPVYQSGSNPNILVTFHRFCMQFCFLFSARWPSVRRTHTHTLGECEVLRWICSHAPSLRWPSPTLGSGNVLRGRLGRKKWASYCDSGE